MFCTNCGVNVPNDAVFCNNCGKQLSRAASQPELRGMVSQGSTSVVILQPKSLAIAGFLELLIPGAGLMYTRQVVVGIVVLLVTVGAAICVGLIYSSMVQQAIAIASGPTSPCAGFVNFNYNPCADYSAANNFRGFFWVCAIAWVAGRIAWAANAAAKYNRSIADATRQL